MPLKTAVWLPPDLHERVSFEINLPSKVRLDLSKQDLYPVENLPGYPSSGPKMNPKEYDYFEPVYVDSIPGSFYERGLLRPPYYVPLYREHTSNRRFLTVDNKADDVEKLIPGTDITESQLNEKVMTQLLEHKMVLEAEKQDIERKLQKLLEKRERVEENTLGRKSVTFEDTHVSDMEDEGVELDGKDSGRGSATTDIGLSDAELEELLGQDAAVQTKDVGVNIPDEDKIFRRRNRRRTKSASDKEKPPWKYWGNDPAPDLMDPMHFGPYRLGRYQESTIGPPLEAKLHKTEQRFGK